MPCSSVASARRTSPGLIPSAPGLREVDLDLEVRTGWPAARRAGSRRRRHRTRAAAPWPPDGGGRLVLAEHADGERLVGARQHVQAVARDRVLAFLHRSDVLDLLRRVGGDAVAGAANAVHGVLDGGERRVVVGAGVDADPDLARVDVPDLVRSDCASHMGADVVDTGDVPQLTAELRREARHTRIRGPRLAVEPHQHVTILERRNHGRVHQRYGDERDHHTGTRGDQTGARVAHEARDRAVVARSEPPQDG